MTQLEINLDRVIGQVDPRIFGGFIEHLARCIYGGVYDEGSPLSDERGFRQDVLEAAKALRMPVLRWPGGNFVSNYHWTDGIGPVDERPSRPELAWNSTESNRFGTDEFMAYCRELGTEPYLCLNMGTGTLEEALAWVEYCNGTKDTYWANKRRKNGHEEPYRVRYWGLGNEMWGPWQVGNMSAEEYVATAKRWAHALRLLDPEIQLVSCGQDGWSEWDRVVIDGMIQHVEFHSIHLYSGATEHLPNVLSSHQADRALSTCSSLIERARYLQKVSRPVHVAYDEWNVWRGDTQNDLFEQYSLSDALGVATYLNVFVRHSKTVKIANLAQLVNVIAPIMTSPDGLYLQSIYHPLRLAAEHTQALAVDAYVHGETLEYTDPTADDWPHKVADLGPFQELDVAATRDADGRRLVVSVINRSPDTAVPATLAIRGAEPTGQVVARVVDGAGVEAYNSFDQPDAVTVTEQTFPAGDGVTFEFPAHSYVQLDIELTGRG